MDIRQLRYFLAVARELHFGRAAERVHIAQSPLSRQIKQLEESLGVTLFRRSKRKVELTEAGRALMADAQSILDATEQARRTALNAQAGMIGRLRIAFTNSSVYTVLPRIFFEFRRSHPQVELVLRDSALTPVQVDGLISGQLDIGVLRPPVSNAAIGLLTIAREELVVALPENHPLTACEQVDMRSLAGEAFVAFPRSVDSSLATLMHRTCLDAGFQMRIVQEVRDLPTMVMLVAGGIGVSLVPSSARSMGVRGAVFRPIAGERRPLEIALGWNRDAPSAVRDRFMEVARAVLQAEA